MLIREAKAADAAAIRHVCMSAFGADERDSVANLALDLLALESSPSTISLLAELNDKVVGAIVFSPVTIANRPERQAYILAPLGVLPDCQKAGIGSALIENGKQRLSEMGVTLLFVYGDPDYYGKFGFGADAATIYAPPYKLAYPFGWQVVALGDGALDTESLEIACVSPLCDPGLW